MQEINKMSFQANREAAEQSVKPKFERKIGRYGGLRSGPLVIFIGGIHGNEPAGVFALRNVMKALNEKNPRFEGEVIALAGNTRALNNGLRYLDRDLNRAWLPEQVRNLKLKAGKTAKISEETEQLELLAEIETAIGANRQEVYILDLHTTSSDGAPFSIISDTLTNRDIAQELGVPIILGIEESIDGTILNYINDLGYAALGFEAGQHDALTSIENHEAIIWLSLAFIGCLSPNDIPDMASLRKRLIRASRGLPRFLEVRYRHAIAESDEFAMDPGFRNFHPVKKNQAIAKDRTGEVKTNEAGFLFMPLYQKLGDDGFFLVREVKPFWMKVSEVARRMKFDRALPLLPGVSRLKGAKDSLVIDTRIAHWFVLEICHLLGFRKHYQTTGRLIVSRRKQQEL